MMRFGAQCSARLIARLAALLIVAGAAKISKRTLRKGVTLWSRVFR
jgi:hypothetical protein